MSDSSTREVVVIPGLRPDQDVIAEILKTAGLTVRVAASLGQLEDPPVGFIINVELLGNQDAWGESLKQTLSEKVKGAYRTVPTLVIDPASNDWNITGGTQAVDA